MGVSSRKELEKARSESRQTRKRKRNETVTDLPEADVEIAEERLEGFINGDGAQGTKDEKKTKKRKKNAEDYKDEVEVNMVGDGKEDGTKRKKSKRVKKEEKEKEEMKETKKKNARRADDTKGEAIAVEEASTTEPTEKRAKKPKKSKKSEAAPAEAAPSTSQATKNEDADPPAKSQRFIVFIGNLPYTTTTASLTAHFTPLLPFTTRHLTSKEAPHKSKGYAFLEFPSYDRMSTCLQMFHHSVFDDGLSPARKINVELTAGGGGKKSGVRSERLKVKNERLNERRARKIAKDDEERKKKGGGVKTEESGEVAEGGVHPSRRSRVAL